MKKAFHLLVASTFLVGLSACNEGDFREDVVFAGGKYVKAETLNKGKQIYTEYCMACHGVEGDGKGVAHKGLVPPPRNFKLGIYKFGHVLSGELPHDEDFYDLLDKGLHGTAMLPWDLTDDQKHAVVSYIKTFAMDTWKGKDKELPERIVPTKDPFGMAREGAAIQKGKEVYHAVANCQSCHRAYVSFDELDKINKKINDEVADRDPSIYEVKPQESEHEYKTVPPDFTWHTVRSAKNVNELYVRLASGVGGTSMPSWKDTITDEEIWAVAYYVKSLMDLKNTQARNDLVDGIKKANAK